MVEILRYRALPSLAWKNGAGQTKEVTAFPSGGKAAIFDWRLSIATIQESSLFSAYPGIDRKLVNCGEGSMDLDINGSTLPLEKYGQAAFRGEDTVYATLHHGSTQDLNLMTRRSVCAGGIHIRRSLNGPIDQWDRDLQAIVVLSGYVTIDGAELGALDSIVRLGPDTTVIFDDAVVAEIGVRWNSDVSGAV